MAPVGFYNPEDARKAAELLKNLPAANEAGQARAAEIRAQKKADAELRAALSEQYEARMHMITHPPPPAPSPVVQANKMLVDYGYKTNETNLKLNLMDRAGVDVPLPVPKGSMAANISTWEKEKKAAVNKAWDDMSQADANKIKRDIRKRGVNVDLGKVTEAMIPVYGTVKYWDDMQDWEKGLSVGLDLLLFAPVLRAAKGTTAYNALKAARVPEPVIQSAKKLHNTQDGFFRAPNAANAKRLINSANDHRRKVKTISPVDVGLSEREFNALVRKRVSDAIQGKPPPPTRRLTLDQLDKLREALRGSQPARVVREPFYKKKGVVDLPKSAVKQRGRLEAEDQAMRARRARKLSEYEKRQDKPKISEFTKASDRRQGKPKSGPPPVSADKLFPDTGTQPDTLVTPAPKIKPGTGAQPDTKVTPAPQVKPDTSTQPDTKVTPVPQVKPDTKTKPETKTKPDIKVKPDTGIKPAPTPKPAPKPTPRPKPSPSPKPAPTPKPPPGPRPPPPKQPPPPGQPPPTRASKPPLKPRTSDRDISTVSKAARRSMVGWRQGLYWVIVLPETGEMWWLDHKPAWVKTGKGVRSAYRTYSRRGKPPPYRFKMGVVKVSLGGGKGLRFSGGKV